MFSWLHLIKDSRGSASWTHTLAIPAAIGITLWYLIGGIDLTVPGGYHVITATRSGTDYAAAVGVWLAFFAQREYTEKTKPAGGA